MGIINVLYLKKRKEERSVSGFLFILFILRWRLREKIIDRK